MSTRTLVIGDRKISSWSLRPWLLLKMAGIPFSEAHVKLRQPDTRDQCLRYSPSGKIPVLIDGGITVWDTLAIAEYVAETWPEKSLWPKDKAARALARSVVAEMHSGFADMRRDLTMDITVTVPTPDMAEGTRRDVARVQEIWRDCLAKSGGPFLFGSFSIADAFYAPVVTRFITYQIVLDNMLQDYVNTIMALPPMAEWKAAAMKEVQG